MHDDQVNIITLELYDSGRPRYYIAHDPITDEKMLVERRDAEGSPLHATAQILNGFLHGKLEIYNAKSTRVCQDAVYRENQMISESFYTYEKVKHPDDPGHKKRKRKICVSRTLYNHQEQQATNIRLSDKPRQDGLLTFQKTLFDLTDQSVISQETHTGLLINNVFFSLRNKACTDDKTPPLMRLCV
ncbi:MAG TPA: hypothetical protein VGF14_01215 [Alphaproteobacteria bacterium]